MHRRLLPALLIAAAVSLAADIPLVSVSMHYADARPFLESMKGSIPTELATAIPGADAEAKWNIWSRQHDKEIRARLFRGEEDSVVNLLLSGTSFTQKPRVPSAELEITGNGNGNGNGNGLDKEGSILRARLNDMVEGIAHPEANERLQFARHLVELWGLHPDNREGRDAVRKYLLDNLKRVISEQADFRRAQARYRQPSEAKEASAERSKLNQARGISLETSIPPDFALEQALAELMKRNLLSAGSVRRVAIIGPGLDFANKAEGYDFYPQQTIQPFAVLDSIARLKLGKPDKIELITLDLSPRVNDHLARARKRAESGSEYTLQLPRSASVNWKPELLHFWEKLGEKIGSSGLAVTPPAGAGQVKVRAINVNPAVVRHVRPSDVNVILQRLQRGEGEGFDLIIATNVLVYYDVFEQSLALANIEAMLRPGGLLLTNNPLPELPFARMHALGDLSVVYSDRPEDGDRIVWYQRK